MQFKLFGCVEPSELWRASTLASRHKVPTPFYVVLFKRRKKSPLISTFARLTIETIRGNFKCFKNKRKEKVFCFFVFLNKHWRDESDVCWSRSRSTRRLRPPKLNVLDFPSHNQRAADGVFIYFSSSFFLFIQFSPGWICWPTCSPSAAIVRDHWYKIQNI
jgi:hypothetical protein